MHTLYSHLKRALLTTGDDENAPDSPPVMLLDLVRKS
jgi:hypothetical protein